MKLFLSTILLIVFKFSFAYLSTNPDSIRGALRLERTCYDVTFYDLKVDIDPDRKRIEAEGVRDAQLIIKEGISEGNIEWRSLEVLKEISTSPNAKLIITDGKTPVLINGE